MARAACPDCCPIVWTHCSVYKGTAISPLAKQGCCILSYLVPVLCPGTWSEAALLPSPGIQAEQSAAERAFHGRAVERDKRSTQNATALLLKEPVRLLAEGLRACPDHWRVGRGDPVQ